MRSCCICGKEVGAVSDGLLIDGRNTPICDECGKKLDLLDNLDKSDPVREEAYAALRQDMRNHNASMSVIEAVNEIYNQEETEESGADSEEDPEALDEYEEELMDSDEEDETYTELCSKVLLTTANNLEGYHITKQLGVVFGETVYKPSAGQQFASSLGDMFRAFSFSAKEMSGQVAMIESARRFAYTKMIKAALRRGANAIIAIDSDNTIGGDVFYTSLYGTAVYVVIDDDPKA